jgi:hypothetical protein
MRRTPLLRLALVAIIALAWSRPELRALDDGWPCQSGANGSSQSVECAGRMVEIAAAGACVEDQPSCANYCQIYYMLAGLYCWPDEVHCNAQATLDCSGIGGGGGGGEGGGGGGGGCSWDWCLQDGDCCHQMGCYMGYCEGPDPWAQ